MSIEITARPCVFTLPDGWSPVGQADEPALYFERQDKPWGAYVTTLDFTAQDANRSPAGIAAHVQQLHEAAFFRRPGSDWTFGRPTVVENGDEAISTVELFDETSRHRIVSRAHVVGRLAAHITLHHFACHDLPASVRESAAILGTVRRDRASD